MAQGSDRSASAIEYNSDTMANQRTNRSPKPTNDVVFRTLLGSNNNVDLLVAFLSSILGIWIKSAVIKNPFNLATYLGDKTSIVDIKAQDEHGAWYNIELQMRGHMDYGKRALYYLCKIYVEQLAEGQDYMELNTAIGIHILGFNMFDDDRALHRFAYQDTQTGEAADQLGHTQLIFVELPKFHKDWSEISTDLDKWIAFLKTGETLSSGDLPKALQGNPAITKAISTLEWMGADPAVRQIWEEEEKATMIERGEIEYARREGKAVGIAEGAVREARNMLLLVGEGRLGKPDSETIWRLEAISSVEALEAMARRLLAVESWAELLT